MWFSDSKKSAKKVLYHYFHDGNSVNKNNKNIAWARRWLPKAPLTWKGYVGIIAGVALVVLLFTEYSPLHAFHNFVEAVEDIVSDFDLAISRDISDCQMILWTRKNRSKQQVLTEYTAEALAKTHFNRSHPVKVLLHGFSDEPSTTWTRQVKWEYLKKGEYNIFSVDWQKLTISPWYTTAAKNAARAGKFAANFIHLLVSPEVNVSWSDIHVIGASLGAQAAAAAGYYTNGQLSRITGLDPSGPLFHSVGAEKKLDSSDARFVDVIHSAGRWVGNDDVLGHVDFFPNLGKASQPGCEDDESLDLTCSHFMSWRFFAHSINAKVPYYAIKCGDEESFVNGRCCMAPDMGPDKIAVMGDPVDPATRGKYYLWTNRTVPKATKAASVNCQWIS